MGDFEAVTVVWGAAITGWLTVAYFVARTFFRIKHVKREDDKEERAAINQTFFDDEVKAFIGMLKEHIRAAEDRLAQEVKLRMDAEERCAALARQKRT